ncbi:hypothetical protein BDW02DRAFT_529770 [Decorospora gaudefroyi]|uniref:DUF6590 domain-containing protein n=1 Tax=Decorospora gaudefroyi TaxID=184978 RepID=A0A6A5K6M5_9PLEO|nr:hypothetical protein BDW02DRAFT_529770 [Decorospora gaudefroyi]
MSQPQRTWNHEYQRYLETHYDTVHQRHYRKHYVEGEGWVFFDWLTRPDSGYAAQSLGAGFIGQGPAIQGTYNPVNAQPDAHYETLDSTYFVRHKEFFQEGKVFSILFTEPLGSTAAATSYNDSVSLVKLGGQVYTQVRRFIVVRQKREFCFALPIFTYSGKGTKKSGVVVREHAIAYAYGSTPTLLPGEYPLEKDPICIVMTAPANERGSTLSPSSRIYFGIHHPIQYNVKVKDLGYVLPEHVPQLTAYWRNELQVDTTGQGPEVAAEAAEQYLADD